MSRSATRSDLLLQAESAISCNISCTMCPWGRERARAGNGLMDDEVWSAIRPHLGRFRYVDLSGGGEPMLNPRLAGRLSEAVNAGCKAGFLTNATLLDAQAASEILLADPDWIGVSLDGARPETYESIRRGADFETVTGNVRRLSAMRSGERPAIYVQCVVMPANLEELPEMVRLAAELGAARLVLKNCDVVRTEAAQQAAVYAGGGRDGGKKLKKALKAAEKAAAKLGLDLASYSAKPDELPACEQDPRRSFFVAYDGRVAPCIGLAYGGEGRFFGEKTTFPSVIYGRLPDDDLMELGRCGAAALYKEVFDRREAAYGRALSRISGDLDLVKFKRLMAEAAESMPAAPPGCNRCHYLYGV